MMIPLGFSVSALLLFFLTTVDFIQPALIQVDRTLSILLASNQTSANSNLTIILTIPQGEILPNNIDFNMPPGWDIRGGASVAQGAKVGTGRVQIRYKGTLYNLDINFFNEQSTLGNKARWKVVVGDEPFTIPEGTIFWNWTGSAETGHVLNLNSPIIQDLDTFLELNFTFFGLANTGEPVLVNPATAGNYSWSFDLNFFQNQVNSFSISMPISSTAAGSIYGTLTPAGTNVTDVFTSSLSITYAKVLGSGGQTTVTVSSSPPVPTETGTFTLGGAYYDFSTTAKIDCPCTVTLPYDPAITPDPRIYHLESGVWVDVTTLVDVVNRRVTGVVSSLSLFTTGQSNFSLEFLDPVSALLKKSEPIQLARNRTLPVSFTLKDLKGNFVVRGDVSLQVVDASTNLLKGEITTEALKNRYLANLNIGELNLPDGIYRLRVKAGSTTFGPTPLFTPVEPEPLPGRIVPL